MKTRRYKTEATTDEEKRKELIITLQKKQTWLKKLIQRKPILESDRLSSDILSKINEDIAPIYEASTVVIADIISSIPVELDNLNIDEIQVLLTGIQSKTNELRISEEKSITAIAQHYEADADQAHEEQIKVVKVSSPRRHHSVKITNSSAPKQVNSNAKQPETTFSIETDPKTPPSGSIRILNFAAALFSEKPEPPKQLTLEEQQAKNSWHNIGKKPLFSTDSN